MYLHLAVNETAPIVPKIDRHLTASATGVDSMGQSKCWETLGYFFRFFFALGLRSRTGGISILYCFQYIK